MLASTVQFSTNNQPPPHRAAPTRPPPTFHAPPVPQDEGCSTGGERRRPAELVSVPPSSTTPNTTRPPGNWMTVTARAWLPLNRPPRGATGRLLLRKEVIQPHLPVRLPCYDFVPIADPA